MPIGKTSYLDASKCCRRPRCFRRQFGRDLRKLDLRWINDSYGSLDERVLHQLKPNMNVRCLVIVGYGGSRFPAWLIDPFLVDLEA